MHGTLKRKWRPRLWSVVLLVLGLVLCLPFAGLFLFKFYDSQLVQQTEESLLTQASVLSASYAQLYESQRPDDGRALRTSPALDPVFPSLSINQGTVLPPRPDGTPAETPAAAVYLSIAPQLTRIAQDAQARTLAGYRFLDAEGRVFAGTAEIGQSLANVAEVAQALDGRVVSAARVRVRESPEPVLYSLSRGARVRVFVAMPVLVEGTVVGAVYISRTPNHIFRFLYGERVSLAKAGAFVLLSTGLIGFVFWRFITSPIHLLIRRTQSAAQGSEKLAPLDKFGTREIENLSQSFHSLTERLQRQQDALKSYTAHVTHELKSPLTTLKGAAELLRDDQMPADQRHRLLDAIDTGGKRMEDLLENMRAFSLADQSAAAGICRLRDVEQSVASTFPDLDITLQNPDAQLPMDARTLTIILTHLLENAAQHAADHVTLTVERDDAPTAVLVSDNGTGISPGNRDKILTPFFTTRRDAGGTGMGLSIVKATVEALGGRLSIIPQPRGAGFRISFG